MKSRFVVITILLVIIFSVAVMVGCAETNDELGAEYESLPYLHRQEHDDIPKFAETTQLAGWIVIYDGRLYFDEARVYMVDQWRTFGRHAGENVIVFDAGDVLRMETYGFEDGRIPPNGYQIQHLGRGVVSFEITEQSMFSWLCTRDETIELFGNPVGTLVMADELGERWSNMECHFGCGVVFETPYEFMTRFDRDCWACTRICVERRFDLDAGEWICDHDICLVGNRREPIVFLEVGRNGRVVWITEEFLFTQ